MRKIAPLFLLILLLCGCAACTVQSSAQGTVQLSPSTETPSIPASSGPEPLPPATSDAVPSMTVTAAPSPSPIFNDDISTSREGTLKNGRKYVFYGTDKQSFSIEKYIEKSELVNIDIYDIKIQEKTIEAVAERVQVLFGFGFGNANPERAGLTIYYDEKTEALMFIKDYYGVPQAGGFSVLVVNCTDGLTTMYSSRYC